MHNLSGVFLEECEKKVIEGNTYFSFSVVYPKKTRVYYVEKEEEYKSWINSIKKAIGYNNLNDSYEIIYNIKDINSSFEQIFVCKFILN